MAEPEKQFEYKGHNVNISTIERKGRWSWSYTIDGIDYHAMQDRPIPSEGMAILEAAHDARYRIDNKK